MLDPFQIELSALLKKYGKKIVVSINPMVVDDPEQKQEVSEEVVKKVLEGEKK